MTQAYNQEIQGFNAYYQQGMQEINMQEQILQNDVNIINTLFFGTEKEKKEFRKAIPHLNEKYDITIRNDEKKLAKIFKNTGSNDETLHEMNANMNMLKNNSAVYHAVREGVPITEGHVYSHIILNEISQKIIRENASQDEKNYVQDLIEKTRKNWNPHEEEVNELCEKYEINGQKIIKETAEAIALYSFGNKENKETLSGKLYDLSEKAGKAAEKEQERLDKIKEAREKEKAESATDVKEKYQDTQTETAKKAKKQKKKFDSIDVLAQYETGIAEEELSENPEDPNYNLKTDLLSEKYEEKIEQPEKTDEKEVKEVKETYQEDKKEETPEEKKTYKPVKKHAKKSKKKQKKDMSK